MLSDCELEMMPIDVDEATCDSVSSSFCGSLTGSFGSLVAMSTTTILSSAMASGLTLKDQGQDNYPTGADCSGCEADIGTNFVLERTVEFNAYHHMSPHKPPDFEWLHERCDGDTQLVLEVLRCFCEQGQTHVQAMQIAMKEMDMSKLVFHAVRDLMPDCGPQKIDP
jgi:hypothetical protein